MCILERMTTPVPTRFTDEELALIDELVNEGVGESRSAVIRQGIHDLAESTRRSRVGATIADSYRATPQAPEDDELAMASAVAMTEAEPW
ncbi:MAG: Arc/MetJ-type ribon-helix-helix transcriptional regulator [Acidimicrobiales bacterium]|jgi:Arc/MetJ-type ribon-helix-helix transcriptional regulator